MAILINLLAIFPARKTMVERPGVIRYGSQEILGLIDNAIQCKIFGPTCINAGSVAETD
jgi:hypothetical protein